MKEKLLKLLKVKEEQREALKAKAEKSEDVTELRSIHSEMEKLNAEITELRSMVTEAEKEPEQKQEPEQNERTKNANEHTEQREGVKFTPVNGFHSTEDGKQGVREKEAEQAEQRGKDLKEGRSVTIAAEVVVPKKDGTVINGTFQQVSSLIDAVDTLALVGGESFDEPYEKTSADGEYTAEGAAAKDTDTSFGYANMTKAKVTAYSEITEEVLKLPAADYADVVTGGITTSLRKKLAKEIMVGDGATNHLTGIFSDKATAIDAKTDLEISAIDKDTLNNIVYSYGGDEAVEGQATLILSKLDLKAFANLRADDGRPLHTITFAPGSNGMGFIDGIPFIINSACQSVSKATAGGYCMAYGNLKNYRLVTFSDIDVQRSTDYKFKEGMIANRGVAFVGGNVKAYNGFIRVKKATA